MPKLRSWAPDAGACGQLVVQSSQKAKGGVGASAGCSRDSNDIEEIGQTPTAATPSKAPKSIWNLFGTVA
jgi:hypothetical protein